jgi:hypothetical protein
VPHGGAADADANGDTFRIVVLDGVVVAGCVGVKKKPSAPQARLGCIHLQSLLRFPLEYGIGRN